MKHVARIPKRVKNKTTEHNETNILKNPQNFMKQKKCHPIACSRETTEKKLRTLYHQLNPLETHKSIGLKTNLHFHPAIFPIF